MINYCFLITWRIVNFCGVCWPTCRITTKWIPSRLFKASSQQRSTHSIMALQGGNTTLCDSKYFVVTHLLNPMFIVALPMKIYRLIILQVKSFQPSSCPHSEPQGPLHFKSTFLSNIEVLGSCCQDKLLI